ncbi:hypothetical protein SCUP234_01631 [Seiridium cupressi]
MSKRTTFTTISPLPASVSRQVVLDFLHDHQSMIDLNPLVIERHPLPEPPPHCPEDERQCVWWSMTDKIAYAPGIKSDLTYTAAFQDLHDGIRTHCYAPMGTHIRERWSLGGTLPGEPKQPVELGLGAPSQGLYIREDVEVRCNFLMAGFVKKTILKSHGVLCERLVRKAESSGATATPLSPASTVFHDGHSFGSGGRSSSTHDERRSQFVDGSSGRQSPSNQIHQNPYHHRHQQSSGSLQPIYTHQIAAASETGLVPEPLRTGRSSVQYGHSRHDSGQIYTGQGWQAQQKPYVHDPHNPYTRQQAPQIPPLSGLGNGQLGGPAGGWVNGTQNYHQATPVAELSGGESHIAELP